MESSALELSSEQLAFPQQNSVSISLVQSFEEGCNGDNSEESIKNSNLDDAFAGLVAEMIELEKRQQRQPPIPVTPVTRTGKRDNDATWMFGRLPSHAQDVRLWLCSKRMRNDPVGEDYNVCVQSKCSCCSSESSSICSWGLVLNNSIPRLPQQTKRRASETTSTANQANATATATNHQTQIENESASIATTIALV
eukprot:jgi/Psemu1/302993/fgenesh1_kg.88_\